MTLEIVRENTNNITLLKICNSLLKRLSKSTHNELRGRVHMLLASILELGDKSGLNKKSTINGTALHVVTRVESNLNNPDVQNTEVNTKVEQITPSKENDESKDTDNQKNNKSMK